MTHLIRTLGHALLLAVLGTALAGPALADERPMSGDEIRAALTDKWMRGTDSDPVTLQLFLSNGVTHHAQGGAITIGRWEVRGNQYCSAWPPNPAWACYDMVQDGATYTFISGSGRRYEVRPDR